MYKQKDPHLHYFPRPSELKWRDAKALTGELPH